MRVIPFGMTIVLTTTATATLLNNNNWKQLAEGRNTHHHRHVPDMSLLPSKVVLAELRGGGDVVGNEDTTKLSDYISPKRNVATYRMKKELRKIWIVLLGGSGPIVTVLARQFCRPKEAPMTTLAAFALALAGSSLGFYSFLYFVTVGYGLSIALVTGFALLSYNTMGKTPIPLLSNIHTSLAFVWAIRLMVFLLHREYVNWPEWHEKLHEVNRRAKVRSKFSVWMTCGPFYAMMATPCIYRLQQSKRWGTWGKIGIGLQSIGLMLESVADYQKSTFKANHRTRLYTQGLWSVVTHPNYLGEILFWIGTYMGGSYPTFRQWTISTIGMVFILVVMKGAIESLNAKHLRQYGDSYLEYRSNHHFFLFGPSPTREPKSNPLS